MLPIYPFEEREYGGSCMEGQTLLLNDKKNVT